MEPIHRQKEHLRNGTKELERFRGGEKVRKRNREEEGREKDADSGRGLAWLEGSHLVFHGRRPGSEDRQTWM